MVERTTWSNLRHCPRCGGNLYLDSDEYGRFEHCLQCGYTAEQVNMAQEPDASAVGS